MNRGYILFHLREASGALASMISELETDPEYEYPEFRVDIEHLYHHVNSAWNARDADPERADACSEEDFQAWRQFPSDLELV